MKYSLKMNFIITTLFIVSCIIVIANCGDYYKIDGRTYYTSYPEKKIWYDAKLACAANGTLLVDVPTADENARLLSVINKTETKHNLGFVAWWTSGSEMKNKNKFIWETTGNPVVYANWHYREPNNNNGLPSCIAFYEMEEHKWYDYYCVESLYFICRSKQVELPVVVPILDPVVESVEVENLMPVTDPVVVPTNVQVVVPVSLAPVETLDLKDLIDCGSGVHLINSVTLSVICFALYIL